MDMKQIRQLASILNKEGIDEFEWKDGEKSIRLRRFSGSIPAAPQAASPIPIPAPAPVAVPEISEPGKITPAQGNQFITSPIVGTFYRAQSPKADPYVKIGDKVTKGQVLCILEAMKLMNELEAEYPCEIVKILVENAEPVEFGEPLFEVKPL
ncbi:acetyl-CoA carboxylase biotin carboxyl carrier protein [bacterium]|nr:acetyl-CoA carboxylase biotin carboxyl carrier protein [candidate division CSSED10-310 bacterium]